MKGVSGVDGSAVRQKMMEEVNLLPTDRLTEAYELIHYFRLGLRTEAPQERDGIMRFAGCWSDMSQDAFEAFSQEIAARRLGAFDRRRSDEAGAG